jgi:thymidine kinase
MSITCIVGEMFSGKSTELMQRYRWARVADVNAILIAPPGATRGGNWRNVSHDHLVSVPVTVLASDLWRDPPELTDAVRAIYIDEAQFIDGVRAFCLRHKRAGRTVVTAGLRSDHRGESWPNTRDLILCDADEVVFKHGVCVVCHAPSIYSRKVGGDRDAVKEVGGVGMYVSVCQAHLAEPADIPRQLLADREARLQSLSTPAQ